MRKSSMLNQKAFTNVFLLLVATVGIISYLVISNTVDFRQKPLISKLSTRPSSQAIVNRLEQTVFAYYYTWYTPPVKGVTTQWAKHWRNPPEDIDSRHYPSAGPYDGSNDFVIDYHMQLLKAAKVDVIILSYWGINHPFSSDDTVKKILAKAQLPEYRLKVAFNIEPAPIYDEIKHDGQFERIHHILYNLAGTSTNPGSHPALFKVARKTKWAKKDNVYNLNPRPLFLFFNWTAHYQDVEGKTTEETKLIYQAFFDSLRNTPYDGFFLPSNANGSLVLDPDKPDNPDHSAEFGIDSMHADGNFGYNEDTLWTGKTFAKSDDYINLIHVAPGFDKTKIGGTKMIDRRNGAYYDDSWKEVAAQKPEWVVILTFNEWGENSQIEPAKPHTYGAETYLDYQGHYGLTGEAAQMAYINRTAFWVNQYKASPPPPSSTPPPTPTQPPPPPNSPTPSLTPTPTPTPIPTSTPTPKPGSVITIWAAGNPAKGEYPKMTLYIDYQHKATFTVDKGWPLGRIFQTFTYRSDTPITAKQVQIGYINDYSDPNKKEERDLLVNFVNIDGKRYEIESPTTYSTGTKIDGKCQPGYPKSEWLHCDGYLALEASN